jgi:hypothetical protein
MSFIDHFETQLVQAGHRRIERRWRNRLARWLRSPRRRGAAVVVAALLVGAPATAAVVGWNPFDDPGRDPRVGTPSVSDRAPTPALLQMLAPLRREQTADERQLVSERFRSEGDFTELSGVQADYIRVLDAERGIVLVPAERFFVVLGRRTPDPNTPAFRNGVCLYNLESTAAGFSCFTADRIRRGFALVQAGDMSIGLVPDGVARVRLLDGERAGEADVRDNLFVTGREAPVAPMVIEWIDDGGRVIKRTDLTRPAP